MPTVACFEQASGGGCEWPLSLILGKGEVFQAGSGGGRECPLSFVTRFEQGSGGGGCEWPSLLVLSKGEVLVVIVVLVNVSRGGLWLV